MSVASRPEKPPRCSGSAISLPWFRQASLKERLGRLTSLRRGRTRGVEGRPEIEVNLETDREELGSRMFFCPFRVH